MALFDREREILADLMDLADLKEGIARIEARLGTLEEKVDKMSEQQTEINTDVAAIQAALTDVASQTATLTTVTGQIQQEITNLQNANPSLDLSALDALATSAASAASGLDSAVSGVSALAPAAPAPAAPAPSGPSAS